MDFDELRRKHHALIPKKFGFDCGPGWIKILDDLFSKLDSTLAADIELQLLQVKEKLGGLRFYCRIEPQPPEDIYRQIRRQIDIAQAWSFHICESCGRGGQLMKRDGFYFTACERCCRQEDDAHGRRAVPVLRQPYYSHVGEGEQWHVFDVDRIDFVPAAPPDDFDDP